MKTKSHRRIELLCYQLNPNLPFWKIMDRGVLIFDPDLGVFGLC
jgi:hypothetical protein